MDKIKWGYEKLNDKGKIEYCPANDLDGKITGKCIYGLKAFFDENPEERIRLGWTKHIYSDIKKIEYNHQTQYLTKMLRQVDPYTVEDVYYVLNKSEEQMRLEELLNKGDFSAYDDADSIIWMG